MQYLRSFRNILQVSKPNISFGYKLTRGEPCALGNLAISRISQQFGSCMLVQPICVHQCQVFLSSGKSPSRISWHGNTKDYDSDKDIHTSREIKVTQEDIMQKEVDFGILFDIDGVIARGSEPLTAAKKMIKLLTNTENELMIPIAFCTNSTGKMCDKAANLTKWLGLTVQPEQVIPSQGPLSAFKTYHHKRCLFVGQGNLHGIAEELGYTNIVTMNEVKDAFPLLDIVDHDNRKWIAQNNLATSDHRQDFEPIEAVILIGEPNRWETHLQLLIDIIVTGGYPAFAPEDKFPDHHLPIIACNMDLVFMAEACMPRFGHGAFLVCLESLYKKITGKELNYTALIGKPSEITFRYAEHVISQQAQKLNLNKAIKTLYIVGDNPEVDIYGANLYTKYIEDCERNKKKLGVHASRQVPNDHDFVQQTVHNCHGILVSTGVYDPQVGRLEEQEMEVYHHGHRDFEQSPQLRVPSIYATDVYDAVLAILEQEVAISDEINNNMDDKKANRG